MRGPGTWSIIPASYAKNQVVVRAPSKDGMKTVAAKVAESLGGKWVHRSGGYTMSPAKGKVFEAIMQGGRAAAFDKLMFHVRLSNQHDGTRFRLLYRPDNMARYGGPWSLVGTDALGRKISAAGDEANLCYIIEGSSGSYKSYVEDFRATYAIQEPDGG